MKKTSKTSRLPMVIGLFFLLGCVATWGAWSHVKSGFGSMMNSSFAGASALTTSSGDVGRLRAEKRVLHVRDAEKRLVGTLFSLGNDWELVLVNGGGSRRVADSEIELGEYGGVTTAQLKGATK